MAPRSAYIHVPFCLHRCGYCDFTLVANKDHLIPAYLTALEHEMRSTGGPHDVETLFIGGGTPTHLSHSQLGTLTALIRDHFQLASDGEYSIEANPDGLPEEILLLLRDSGVNRISLGVQSFDDTVLRTLERQHSGLEACTVVQRCSQHFPAVSLDLIFGVPGQTMESWLHTLDTALSLPIQHISTYGLTFEPGTAFFRREQTGVLNRVHDEIERNMYLAAIDRIQQAGFEHYEVSNFARPGFRCRHNMTYWNADEYFACGPGAARYLNGVRTTNSRSVPRWIQSWTDHQPCIHEQECLTPEDKAREAIMLGLRMRAGLDLRRFEETHQTASKPLNPISSRSTSMQVSWSSKIST